MVEKNLSFENVKNKSTRVPYGVCKVSLSEKRQVFHIFWASQLKTAVFCAI